MIQIQSMHCGYKGKEVLQNINLHIKKGELAGILGPNGSGKTTLLLAIAGVLEVNSGSIRVAGEDIQNASTRWRARQMASVPQKTEVSFPFRCLSLVLMGRYPYLSRWGGYSREDMNEAFSAMEQTDTLHLAQRLTTEISGGEAQRVIISRTLAQKSPVLLLDEATSSLDVARKIQVFDLLRRKNRSKNMTLLCAMHDLNLAALYCERLIFLKHGRIVVDGPIEKTFNNENLSEIYETDIRISRHPVTDVPQAHYVPDLSLDHGPYDNHGIRSRGFPGKGNSHH